MIIMQAKAKFATYPSPGASHWVHSEYVKHGGQFVELSNDTRQKKLAKKQFEAKRRENLKKRAEHTPSKNTDDKKDTK
jgi:hypothetical protein